MRFDVMPPKGGYNMSIIHIYEYVKFFSERLVKPVGVIPIGALGYASIYGKKL